MLGKGLSGRTFSITKRSLYWGSTVDVVVFGFVSFWGGGGGGWELSLSTMTVRNYIFWSSVILILPSFMAH